MYYEKKLIVFSVKILSLNDFLLKKENETEKIRMEMNLKTLKQRIRQEEKPERDEENIEPKENIRNVAKGKDNTDVLKEENNKLKNRIKKYEDKLAQANKKIMELIKEKAGFINKIKEKTEQNPNAITYNKWDFRDENSLENENQQKFGKLKPSYSEEKLPQFKSPYTGFMVQTKPMYDISRVNYKDEVLLDEINRNINKGMQFYNI